MSRSFLVRNPSILVFLALLAVFTIAVTLQNGQVEEATAGSKRQAEQAAARALLARLEGQG